MDEGRLGDRGRWPDPLGTVRQSMEKHRHEKGENARRDGPKIQSGVHFRRMVPRGGIEPPTLRFSVGERSHHINDLAPADLENGRNLACGWQKPGRLLINCDCSYSPTMSASPPMSGGKADVPGGPSRVIRVDFVMSALCPVCTQHQTFSKPNGTSHLGQKRTSAWVDPI